MYWLAGILTLFVVIEASFRRKLTNLITGVTIGLAVVSALVILYEFHWQIAVLVAVAACLYVLWDNLRELWG